MHSASQLAQQLGNWIAGQLNFRYNKQVPIARFVYAPPTPVVHPLIISDSYQPQNTAFSRIPQSHICIFNFEQSHYSIRLILCESCGVLIENSSSQEELPALFHLKPGWQSCNIDPKSSPSEEKYDVQPIRVSWVIGNDCQVPETDPLSWLQTTLTEQRKQHPLAKLSSTSASLLTDIDEMFYQTHLVSQSNVKYNQYREKAQAFLQDQINLHLNSKVYPDSPETEDLTETEKGLVKQLRAQVPELSWLQEYWQNHHYPAFRFALLQDIESRPYAFCCMALMAVRGRFSWAEQFVNLVSTALPAAVRTLFDLLILLKKHTRAFITEEGWELTVTQPHSGTQKLTSRSRITITHIKNSTFLDVLDERLQLRLNQPVRVLVNDSMATIEMTPLPVIEGNTSLNWNTVVIELDGFKVHVAMAWAALTLEINGVRFRFLRKKQRFQVHIKNRRQAAQIRIANQMITTDKSRYSTIYIPIKPQKSLLQYKLVNDWGAVPFEGQLAHFEGNGCNGFGLQVSGARFGLASGRQTSALGHMRFNPSSWQKDTGRVFARYCDTQEVKIQAGAGVLGRFLYTENRQLVNQVQLVCRDANPRWREIFFQHFRFYPFVVTDLGHLNTQCAFTLVLADKIGDTEVKPENPVQITKLAQDGSFNVIVILPEAFEQLLEKRFNYS